MLKEGLEPVRVVWGDIGAGGESSVLGEIGGIPEGRGGEGGGRAGHGYGLFEQIIWILGLFRGRMWDPEGVRVWDPFAGGCEILERGLDVSPIARGVDVGLDLGS